MKTLGTLHPTDTLPFPDTIENFVLSAGVGQAFDVPTGAGVCVFATNADLWVNYGTTSAVSPTSSTTTTTNSELNPTARRITTGTTGISLYSDSGCKGSLAWFKP